MKTVIGFVLILLLSFYCVACRNRQPNNNDNLCDVCGRGSKDVSNPFLMFSIWNFDENGNMVGEGEGEELCTECASNKWGFDLFG